MPVYSVGPRLMILSIRVTVTDELHRETVALPATAALFSELPPLLVNQLTSFPSRFGVSPSGMPHSSTSYPLPKDTDSRRGPPY